MPPMKYAVHHTRWRFALGSEIGCLSEEILDKTKLLSTHNYKTVNEDVIIK